MTLFPFVPSCTVVHSSLSAPLGVCIQHRQQTADEMWWVGGWGVGGPRGPPHTSPSLPLWGSSRQHGCFGNHSVSVCPAGRRLTACQAGHNPTGPTPRIWCGDSSSDFRLTSTASGPSLCGLGEAQSARMGGPLCSANPDPADGTPRKGMLCLDTQQMSLGCLPQGKRRVHSQHSGELRNLVGWLLHTPMGWWFATLSAAQSSQ